MKSKKRKKKKNRFVFKPDEQVTYSVVRDDFEELEFRKNHKACFKEQLRLDWYHSKESERGALAV